LFHQAEQDLSFQLGLYQNIPGGNLGDTQALHAVRSSANPAYTLLRYALNFNQILPADWQLRAAFNGQQTNDALISGEQFGIGGINSVRGFQERSLANDKGYRGSIELYTPDFGQHVDVVPLNIRALGFFNVANVSRNFALPREAANGHLSSIGLGLRASLDSHFQFRVDISQVLDSGGLTSVGKKLAQASLVYMF
jgi:hemolysin activation/secretion protein